MIEFGNLIVVFSILFGTALISFIIGVIVTLVSRGDLNEWVFGNKIWRTFK